MKHKALKSVDDEIRTICRRIRKLENQYDKIDRELRMLVVDQRNLAFKREKLLRNIKSGVL